MGEEGVREGVVWLGRHVGDDGEGSMSASMSWKSVLAG